MLKVVFLHAASDVVRLKNVNIESNTCKGLVSDHSLKVLDPAIYTLKYKFVPI